MRVIEDQNLRVITTRVPQKVVEYIEKDAEEEHLDKAAVYRKFLFEAIEHDRLERAIKDYVDDKSTLLKAAEGAGLPVSLFAEELNKRNIRRGLGLDAFKEGMVTLQKLKGEDKRGN